MIECRDFTGLGDMNKFFRDRDDIHIYSIETIHDGKYRVWYLLEDGV